MNESTNSCPVCGEGLLLPQVGKNAVEYKEHSIELDLHYSTCDVCGSEQTDAIQLRANKRTMIAFKKSVDGLLSGIEVRELRERLRINQTEAARIFGGGPVAFSKYESDDVAQSEAMDKLLRLSLVMPLAFIYLKQKAGLLAKEVDKWSKGEMVPLSAGPHELHVVSSSSLSTEQTWRKSA